MTAAGGVSPVYDSKGNMRSGAGVLYDYNVDNLLSQLTPGDPAQPSWRFNYAATGELESIGDHLGFEYLDGQMITEVSDAPGFPIQRRYIFGPGADEPLVWYEGGGTTQKYWLHADERGSVVAVTDAGGNAVGTNSYDEYGIPGTNNLGRFQYTGQIWVPEIGLYYYKARMYSPTYGRFMQTDPMGYGDGVNMYGYVGADPVNRKDPNGLACTTNDLYEDLYKGFSDGHLEYLGSNWIGSWVSGCEQVERGSGRSQEGGGGGLAGRANARPVPQNIRIAQRYTGDTFCQNATVGNANRFNPFGRITSGKTGGFDTALADIDRIARVNGIPPLGSVLTNFFSTSAMTQFLIPTPLGDGWSVGKNYWTGDTTISNGGLGFRYNAESGKINIDIPAGSMLPNGGQLAQNETCHYRR